MEKEFNHMVTELRHGKTIDHDGATSWKNDLTMKELRHGKSHGKII